MTSPEDLEFRRMLVDIGAGVSADNLETMKWYCNDVIPKGLLESVEVVVHLWDLLIERDQLGPRKTSFLREMLQAVGRLDLLTVLSNYERNVGLLLRDMASSDASLQQDLDFVVEHINVKKWRNLVRTLGLSDADIDALAQQFASNVREQIRHALLLWVKRSGERATRAVLLDALKRCQLKLIADQIEANSHSSH